MNDQEFTELRRINKRLEILETKLDKDITEGTNIHANLTLQIELMKQKFNHIKWICVVLPPSVAMCVAIVSIGLKFLNLV